MAKRISFESLGILPVFIVIASLLAGCRGIIYTRTVTPLSTNFERSPCDWYPSLEMGEALPWYNIRIVPDHGAGKTGSGNILHVAYDIYDVRWDSNAIGDIALRHGIETVYFADLERLSILRLINSYTVYIYGR
jgi:hypothetical protein